MSLFVVFAALLGASLAVTCPPDNSGCVNVVSPCRVTSCDRSDVTCCVVNCRAIFLLANGTEYKCGSNPPPPAPTCPRPDCTTVRCAGPASENPCANISCKSNARLTCCPGCCNAIKFIDAAGVETKCDDIVNGTAPAPVPPPSPSNICPKADCSTVRCAAPAEDPCKTAKCAADSTATCCAGCCGQFTFVNRRNETVKCEVPSPVPVPPPSPSNICPKVDCSNLRCPRLSRIRATRPSVLPTRLPCAAPVAAVRRRSSVAVPTQRSSAKSCRRRRHPVSSCARRDCSVLDCVAPAESPCRTAKCAAVPERQVLRRVLRPHAQFVEREATRSSTATSSRQSRQSAPSSTARICAARTPVRRPVQHGQVRRRSVGDLLPRLLRSDDVYQRVATRRSTATRRIRASRCDAVATRTPRTSAAWPRLARATLTS
jgi:hypothetical protein